MAAGDSESACMRCCSSLPRWRAISAARARASSAAHLFSCATTGSICFNYTTPLFHLGFGFFDCQNLRGVGGDDLVFRVGRDDFNRNVLQPRKKEPLADIGLQKVQFFLLR